MGGHRGGIRPAYPGPPLTTAMEHPPRAQPNPISTFRRELLLLCPPIVADDAPLGREPLQSLVHLSLGHRIGMRLAPADHRYLTPALKIGFDCLRRAIRIPGSVSRISKEMSNRTIRQAIH